MAVNQDESLCSEKKFDYGCLMGERPDTKGKNVIGFVDSKSEKSSEDIADMLPNDPFGMDVNISLPKDPFGMDINISLPRDPFGMDFNIGATVAAITGWIEDFGRKTSEVETGEDSEDIKMDNKLFAELNFVLSSSMKIESEVEDEEVVDKNTVGLVMDSDNGLFDHHYMLGGNIEECVCFGCEKYAIPHDDKEGDTTDCNDGNEGAPADALFFALGYLGVKGLLSVERVCKSFRETVQKDPLLWRNIDIDHSLNDKLTDNALLQLTDRAQGSLCSLNLVECLKITNSGLKRVLDNNPGLTKLSVPGCIRLSVESILSHLKVFNSAGKPGIKRLRIGGLYGVTHQQFEELKLLLGADKDKQRTDCNPRFYRAGQLYLSLDDERAIDLETCPGCKQVRQVYDCPTESCEEKSQAAQLCRGCTFCIARCINCGCCLNDSDYEETFCLDLVCLACWMDIINCQERKMLSREHPYIHQQASYHFFLYG